MLVQATLRWDSKTLKLSCRSNTNQRLPFPTDLPQTLWNSRETWSFRKHATLRWVVILTKELLRTCKQAISHFSVGFSQKLSDDAIDKY